MFIDTHCHLDSDRYSSDIEDILQRARENRVEKFIIPAADHLTLQRAVDLADMYDNIYFCVGVHPYDIASYDREYLEKFVNHSKCIAIGECGLDYYRLPDNKDEIEAEKKAQKEIFIEQILWAKKLKKPLIVHIRDSSSDSLELLEEYAGDAGGVLHCYNADESLLKLSKKNFYFGIGGVLTFKNAKKLINVYPKIPKDRLLIETDAPYLTPHPHRGQRNEPSFIPLIAQKMSELSSISIEEIEEISTQNTKRLFGI